MATFTMGKVESAPIFPDQETFPGLRNELETMSQSDDLSGPAFLAERWTFGAAVYQPADPDIARFRTSDPLALVMILPLRSLLWDHHGILTPFIANW